VSIACEPIVHTLMPGDVVCADRGERLETLLGSCVAIVLTDRHRTIGAMCHIVHANPASNQSGRPCAHAGQAIDMLYAMVQARGFAPKLCDAYVYGGGNMFPLLVAGPHIGEKNGLCVLDRLQKDGVRVVHQDLGGSAYRRLSWAVGPQPPVADAVAV
jgi:chemotaxis protein CheD